MTVTSSNTTLTPELVRDYLLLLPSTIWKDAGFALIERVEELRGQRDALLTACKALLAEHTKCAGPAIQSDAKMMARNAIDTAEAE